MRLAQTISGFARAAAFLVMICLFAMTGAAQEQTPKAFDVGAVKLSFVPNEGQVDSSVRYQVQGVAGSLAFYRHSVMFTLPETERGLRGSGPRETSPPRLVQVQFLKASQKVKIEGAEKRQGQVNYFIGNDSKDWLSNISTFGEVIYRNIWDGIDLRYDGTEGRLKGTYFLRPNIDPSLIAWRYEGVESTLVDNDGNLLLRVRDAGGRTLSELAPVAWQFNGKQKTPVDVRFVVDADGVVRFELGNYDRTRALVIDPTVVYSTLIGGNGTDHGLDVEVDALGFVYVTGRTHSNPALPGPGWPLQNAFFGYGGEVADAFVTKFDPSGQVMLFSTYIGGGDPNDFSNHDGDDWGLAIDLDSQGNVYICGFTEALNFPVTPNAIQPTKAGGITDAFVCKVSTTGGGLLYSSYLGGGAADFSWGLDVDGSDKVHVVGYTASVDMPTSVNAFQTFPGGTLDAFYYKMDLNALGTNGPVIEYGTYVGFSGIEEFFDVKADDTGLVTLVGTTTTSVDADFVMSAMGLAAPQAQHGGSTDFLIVQLMPVGGGFTDLRYYTYWGGSNTEIALGCDTNHNGVIHLTGLTDSANFPTVNPFLPFGGGTDIVFMKLDPQGAGIDDVRYATHTGTGGTDIGWDVKCLTTTAWFVGGVSLGTHLECFAVRLSGNGNPLGADLFGGVWDDFATGVAVNDTGVVVTGYTTCRNEHPNNANCDVSFPLTNAFQTAYGGGAGDAFLRRYLPWNPIVQLP